MDYVKDLVLFPMIMFAVIFVAVRMAISPMLHNGKMFGLIKAEHLSKMKVIGILTDSDIRKYHEILGVEGRLGRDAMDYRHFREVLEKLNDSGHIDNLEFERKMIKLNKYYSFE